MRPGDRAKPAASPRIRPEGARRAFLRGFSRFVVWHAINMAFKYRRDEHRAHLIVYHLVWMPKRRKAVLVGGAADCLKLIEMQCVEDGWEMLKVAVQPDYINLLLHARPTVSEEEIVKECKELTSLDLRQKCSARKGLPFLWTRSFFAATAGNYSTEVINRSMAAPKVL